MTAISELTSMTRAVLEDPEKYFWDLQGFGMLRTRLSDECRINVWDDRYRVDHVSDIHTHPWDFTSTLVSGRLVDETFNPCEMTKSGPGILRGFHAEIKPGEGGGLSGKGVGKAAAFERGSAILLFPGGWYELKHDEWHRSWAARGSVTVNTRARQGADLAQVFWWESQFWVSAEPKPATAEEVNDIVSYALARWED